MRTPDTMQCNSLEEQTRPAAGYCIFSLSELINIINSTQTAPYSYTNNTIAKLVISHDVFPKQKAEIAKYITELGL